MTNTLPRLSIASTSVSPFAELISALESGEIVKVGMWTISNARHILSSPGNQFIANVQSERFNSGKTYESSITLEPSTSENLLGLKVNLTINIRGQIQSTFEGLPFTIQ